MNLIVCRCILKLLIQVHYKKDKLKILSKKSENEIEFKDNGNLSDESEQPVIEHITHHHMLTEKEHRLFIDFFPQYIENDVRIMAYQKKDINNNDINMYTVSFP